MGAIPNMLLFMVIISLAIFFTLKFRRGDLTIAESIRKAFREHRPQKR
jgi:hypothetical protein